MIGHLKIFGILLIIILGVMVILYAHNLRKSCPGRFLKYIIRYTIVTNIGLIIFFLYTYFELNLPEKFMDQSGLLFTSLRDLVFALLGINIIYYMIAILLAFREKIISGKYRTGVKILAILLSIIYILRIFHLENSLINDIIFFLRTWVFENIIILEIIILLFFIFFWDKATDSGRRRVSIIFSVIYLSRYILAFIMLLLFFKVPLEEGPRLAIGLFVLAYFNLVPFIWLRFVFVPYASTMKRLISEKINLIAIYEDYKITQREAEIIELIMEGKSNEDIKESLYISFHTVKNHIFNIFRKLDVKSRHELIHFFVKRMKG